MNLRSILLVLVAAAGCNNDPAPLTPNHYFQQRAEATCAAITAACLVQVSTCSASRVAEYTVEYQKALASLRDFIPRNAEVCLGKVKDTYGKVAGGTVALKAADYLAMEAVCANVYRGSGAANGACQLDVDCVGELVCDKSFCGTPRPVGLGAGCANIGETCPQGSFCSGATGVWVCSAKAALQGDCASSPCTETLRCETGICVARRGIGEVCASHGDCGSGFCEPYAGRCAEDIRFANGSAACIAMGGV